MVQKEGTLIWVCEWSQGLTHTHKMWIEVSSSVQYFLQMGLLLSPNIYKCLLRVLCPVSRPITTLDCVLLKDKTRAPVARSGTEINSHACLCVLQGQCHNTRCWLAIQRFIFLLTFRLETPKKGSGPTNLWTEPSLASMWAISFPHTPACPGIQYRPTVCQIDINFLVITQNNHSICSDTTNECSTLQDVHWKCYNNLTPFIWNLFQYYPHI